MAYQFTPLQTFEAEVNDRKNVYVKDKLYTVRDGALYSDLDEKVKDWSGEGLVKILGTVANAPPMKLSVGA